MFEIMFSFCAGGAMVAALVWTERRIDIAEARRRRCKAQQRRAAEQAAIWRAQHPRTLEELNAQHRASAEQRMQLAENLRQTAEAHR